MSLIPEWALKLYAQLHNSQLNLQELGINDDCEVVFSQTKGNHTLRFSIGNYGKIFTFVILTDFPYDDTVCFIVNAISQSPRVAIEYDDVQFEIDFDDLPTSEQIRELLDFFFATLALIEQSQLRLSADIRAAVPSFLLQVD